MDGGVGLGEEVEEVVTSGSHVVLVYRQYVVNSLSHNY